MLENANINILIVLFFSLLLCDYVVKYFLHHIMRQRFSRLVHNIVLPFCNAFLFTLAFYLFPLHGVYILSLGMLTLIIKCFYKTPLENALFFSVIINMQVLIFQIFSLSAYSLIFKANLYETLMNESTLFLTIIMGVCISILFSLCFYKQVYIQKITILLHSRREVRFVMISILTLYAFMNLDIFSYRYYTNTSWFSLAQLIISLLMLMLTCILQNHGSRTAHLLEYEIKSNQYEEQLQRQILHYQSYKRYTQDIRTFRHDYKEMMGTVNYLLKNNQNDEAKQWIAKINDDMHKTLGVHKEYSNNELVDAILQDVANIAVSYGIAFQAQLYIPDSFPMKESDLCKIITNICNNALEASEEIPESAQRMFEISSNVKHQWLSLLFQNTYYGTLQYQNDTFDDPFYQLSFGIPLSDAKERVEAAGGLFHVEIDNDLHVFTIRIQLRCNP